DHAVVRQVDRLKRKKVQVIVCRTAGRGRIAVPDALRELAVRGITHLLVEGGRTLQDSFLEAGMVDEVVWFMAPKILGNKKRLKDVWTLEDWRIQSLGKDLQISACLPESFKRSAK